MPAEQIYQMFQKDCELFLQLNDVLNKERKAIDKNDFDELTKLEERKHEIQAQLESNQHKRNDFFQERGFVESPESMQRFINHGPTYLRPAFEQVWQIWQADAKKTKDENNIISQLLTSYMNTRGQKQSEHEHATAHSNSNRSSSKVELSTSFT